MGNKKARGPVTIPLPTSSVYDRREILQTNTGLEAALRKRRSAEVVYYSLPSPGHDVYRRRIFAAKQDAKQIRLEDAPDIEDCYDTDLPWIGYVSFNGASRSFRAKTVLGVSVEVIREFDGYLYLMTVEGVKPDKPIPPRLLIRRPALLETGWVNVEVHAQVTEEQFEEHFAQMTPLPAALHAYMHDVGYTYNGELGVFEEHFRVDGQHLLHDRIWVGLYGKIIHGTAPVVEKQPPVRKPRGTALDIVKAQASSAIA